MESATHYKNGKSKAKNPRKIQFNPGQLKMDIEESKAFAKFLRKRPNLVESSQELYKSHATTYCYFHQKKIDDLIEEYKQDQKVEHEDYDDYQVYIDIIDYLNHSKANKQAKSTILGKLKRIKSFLKENNVKIPEELRYDLRRYDDSEGYYTKQDLPNKQTMRTIINGANPKHKAIFAFVYTTGSGRSETANLTVTNFINGLKEFCNNQDDPKEIIKELDGNTIQKKIIDSKKVEIPVVPKIKMKRQKTNKPYYTITTPECVQIIIDYIKTDFSILDHYNAYENDFDERGRLFGLQAGAVGNAFKETNLKYGFGKRGRYNFFGCHRVRHNHYTQINNPNLANALEGRVVKDKITKTYDHNLDDPEYLREQYKDHMHKFEIFDHYDVAVRDEEIQRLQEENKQLKEQIAKTNKAVEDLGQKIDSNRTNIPTHKVRDIISNYLASIDELNNDRASLLNLMVLDYVKNNPNEFKDTDDYLFNLVSKLDIQIELSNKDIPQQHHDLAKKIKPENIDPQMIIYIDELLTILNKNKGLIKRVGNIDTVKFDYVAEDYLIDQKIDYENCTAEDNVRIAGEIFLKYMDTN